MQASGCAAMWQRRTRESRGTLQRVTTRGVGGGAGRRNPGELSVHRTTGCCCAGCARTEPVTRLGEAPPRYSTRTYRRIDRSRVRARRGTRQTWPTPPGAESAPVMSASNSCSSDAASRVCTRSGLAPMVSCAVHGARTSTKPPAPTRREPVLGYQQNVTES